MRVSLDIPEPKQTLDGSLLRQFADIQRQLMGLMKEQSASGQTLHREWQVAFASQQKTLLGALERLMGIVQKSAGTAHARSGIGPHFHPYYGSPDADRKGSARSHRGPAL